jgi:hypothetical protein
VWAVRVHITNLSSHILSIRSMHDQLVMDGRRDDMSGNARGDPRATSSSEAQIHADDSSVLLRAIRVT